MSEETTQSIATILDNMSTGGGIAVAAVCISLAIILHALFN